MKTRYLSLLVAVLIPVLGSCAPAIRSGAHSAPNARLQEGLTFVWDQESDRAYGDPRLEGNRFFEDRLHEAIEWELALRGIHPTESGDPDLRVHHHLSLTDREWQEEFAEEGGYSRTETFTAEEGSVMVHILDAATGKEVWVGWALADVDAAIESPDAMRFWVYALVGEMFERWPEAERFAEP
jgi:hypothetical protein